MSALNYILLANFCLTLLFFQEVNSAPTLQFSFGTVQGQDLTSYTSNIPVYAYYGIPFAEPPLGELRFKRPVAYRGRGQNSVVSSDDFRGACLQLPAMPGMDEDCLHLNVFTPGVTSQNLFKVMVWIHGGGFIQGDAKQYMPTDLVADHDVIVVTIQYRLGLMGFISTGDEDAPGNYGLWDQILALRWVKDNIRQFGGDPDDVTIFGESAGSASVSILSLSPYSKGLFNKAIMQSGTAFSPWAFITKQKSLENLYSIAENLSCYKWWYRLLPSRNVNPKVIECIRGKPAEAIGVAIEPYQNLELFFMQAKNIEDFFSFEVYAAPIVDGDLLPREPGSLLRDVDYLRENGVLSRSYIAGSTNDEAAMSDGIPKELFQDLLTGDNFRRLAKFYSDINNPLGTNKEVVDFVDFVYSYPRDSADGKLSTQPFADLQTDMYFSFPTVKFLSMLAEVSPQTDTFHYLFDHYPVLMNKTAPRVGTPHAYDLLFQFDNMEFAAGVVDMAAASSQEVKDVFSSTLTEFAKTGNPSLARLGKSPATWPRFDLEDRWYMAVTSPPRYSKRVFPKRISLWQDYLPQVSRNLFARV